MDHRGRALNNKLINSVCNKYGIDVSTFDKFIDSSHGEKDSRYIYIINQSYAIKIYSTSMITEEFLININSLVDRYRSIGLWCPKLIKNDNDKFLTLVSYENRTYRCYVEEYAPYQFSDDKDIYSLKRKMIGHLGRLATLYSDVGLVDHYSMWSVIDLNLMDEEVDEKQENLNNLVKVLHDNGYIKLTKLLDDKNDKVREIIKKDYKKLPRCVYQGDLNPTNLLIDEYNNFVGLIDFNMFGTEVNINCFINESMHYMLEEDFNLSVDEILAKANSIQKELLDIIFEEYTINDLERDLFQYYKFITNISFYPNVQLWIYLIKNHLNEEKVIELIEQLIIEQ